MVPEILQKFSTEAEKWLRQGKIGEIIFSGNTYQVEILDKKSKESNWTFLQFDDQDRLKDGLCTCPADSAGCLHLAVAYLRLFQGHSELLHVRFKKSLWNVLCKQAAETLGYSGDVLKRLSLGRYVGSDQEDRFFVEIRAKNAATKIRLQSILTERIPETEETSIKFSTLSEEEIVYWKQGRPSKGLLYELSFWSDIAKWMMFLQDEGVSYHIHFDEDNDFLPKMIHITFPGLEFTSSILKEGLAELVPSLATVISPLSVFSSLDVGIDRISYDRMQGSLSIKSKEIPLSTLNGAFAVGTWWFVPKQGFYAKSLHPLLATPCVDIQSMGSILTKYGREISSFLREERIHHEPVKGKYSLSFDKEWNLVIEWYIFNQKDMTKPCSRDFGTWIYIEGEGFYPIEERLFDQVITVIPARQVADFISSHRGWLNSQEGFTTHLVPMPVQLTYQVDIDGTLRFSRESPQEEALVTHDFGNWVYIGGEGFYTRPQSPLGSVLQPGLSIDGAGVGTFIRMHQEELSSLSGFFGTHSPIERATLHIVLDKLGRVVVTPEYEKQLHYAQKNVRLYDDFAYVEGEGFTELPPNCRLPERFRQQTLIGVRGLPLFLSYELDTLKKYASYIDPRLQQPLQFNLLVQKMARTENKGWLHLEATYHTEWGDVSIQELISALHGRKRYCFSAAGLIDLELPRFEWLKSVAARWVNTLEPPLLSTLEFLRLHWLDPIQVDHRHLSEYTEPSEGLIDELINFKIPEKPNLEGLKSHLRSYQEKGVEWLWFLYNNTLSGLLCDDMGLGKTHQAMALMASVRHTGRHRFLVVCPTSVIYHWEEKLQQFLPDMGVCTFHGAERNLDEFMERGELLLTSYGVWRIEKENMKDVFFEVAVFDEIQVAKNRSSRIHAALLQVKARMRIGLTGTPIENRLSELKSLFDIILPHYMPSDTVYNEYFVKPIENEGNTERRQRLSRFIHPFILRRKKEEVLSDLPEKSEEIAHCALSPFQQQLYHDVLLRAKEQCLDQLQDLQAPVPYLHIFALLTHLKQICNHPALYLKQVENYQQYESGKWDLFVELLNEARESDQKVVVFSQYLAMLDIMELHLKQQAVEYATIRGSTVNRAEQLRKFNHDPACRLFLGSLQAVGLGIDLTAGSVVIHYDRWWNAARENQATDRVHRIGQTRGVQVFKLVTKGSFEERIDNLITKKGELMESVVAADDQNIVKFFNREELMQLLKY